MESVAQLERLLAPRSLAVVGATEKPGYASRLFRNLVEGGFAGPVHPVSRTRDQVFGRRAFRSLSEIPDPVDVACVVVPADSVAEVVEECGAAGVAVAVVITAGFGEAGEEGRRRREALRAAARRSGVLVIGPNGNGYSSVQAKVWATTFSGLRPKEARPALPVALLSQSGGVGFGAVHERAQDHGYSFAAVLSTGNEEVVTSERLAQDLLTMGTKVVAMVCEDFRDGAGLLRAAQLARARDAWIVVLKIGRSEAGRAAAATHTAALAADDVVIDDLLRQHGIIRVDDIDELVQCVRFLAQSPVPRGRSAIVVSHSGGLASLTADGLGTSGFELPGLSGRARADLDELLPGRGGRTNPVDVTMALREPVVTDVVRAMIRESPDLLVIVTAGDSLLPQRISHAVEAADAPGVAVCVIWTGGVRTGQGMDRLDHSTVPWFTSVGLAATVLDRCRRAASSVGGEPPELMSIRAARPVDEWSGKRLLQEAGLAVPTGLLADSVEELLKASDVVPAPWVLKVVSPDILHKAVNGLLVLGLSDKSSLRMAARQLRSRAEELLPESAWKLVLEAQLQVAAELYLGCTIDRHFGPVVGLGSGGAGVEQAHTVIWSSCPLDEVRALRVLTDLLLTSTTSMPELDDATRSAVARAAVALSRWFCEARQQPQEVEVNPLAVLTDGTVVALDAVVQVPSAGLEDGS